MIEATLRELRNFSRDFGKQNLDISGWTVGKHVEHCCKTMVAVCRALADSKGSPPHRKWSLPRTIVLLTGKIPRGKAEAPDSVLPGSDNTPDSISSILDEADAAIKSAKQLPANSWFAHPFFSSLKRDEALRFILVHNKHHLKIIRDITSPRGT